MTPPFLFHPPPPSPPHIQDFLAGAARNVGAAAVDAAAARLLAALRRRPPPAGGAGRRGRRYSIAEPAAAAIRGLGGREEGTGELTSRAGDVCGAFEIARRFWEEGVRRAQVREWGVRVRGG